MRVGRSLLAIAILFVLHAPPAHAGGPDFRFTAGGGAGGIGQFGGVCPADNDLACDTEADDAALLLGIAILDSGDTLARAGLRAETLFGFEEDAFGAGAIANALIGVQGDVLYAEGGLGVAALYLADDRGDRFAPGLSVHLGVGFHFTREVSATARMTGAIGDGLGGGFLGVSLEWSPWRAPPSPRQPWEL